jgi:ribosomal protein S18 acetylase RimI-like enzyme
MKVTDLTYKFLKTNEFEEQGLKLPRFLNNIYDSYKNEAFGEFLCLSPDYDWDKPESDKIYGYIKFTYFDNQAYIQMVETNKRFTRMGIGAELVHQFTMKYDDIVLSLQTEEGAKLFDYLEKHGYHFKTE